ncbi:MAG: hypothetical protein WAV48_04550 [Candidatus Magasanikiibacteriota bacterium]
MTTYFIEVFKKEDVENNILNKSIIEESSLPETIMKRLVELTKNKESFTLYVGECIIDES